MTDLTEKWKNGELEDGFYYTQTGKDRIIAIDMYNKESNTWLLNSDKDMPPFEVLDKVQTFEELQDMKEYLDYSIKNRWQIMEQLNYWMNEKDKIKEENEKLKGLLKRCYPSIKEEKDNWVQQGYWDAGEKIIELVDLLKDIDEVIK